MGTPCDELKAQWPMWDTSLLPTQEPYWYCQKETELGQEWRPLGCTYLCAGEPADVFTARMRALKEWLVQRHEVRVHRVLPVLIACHPAVSSKSHAPAAFQSRIVVFCHVAVLRALLGKKIENCESVECSMADLVADVLVVDASRTPDPKPQAPNPTTHTP